MYYYDNVDNENDLYYDLEKFFNDESEIFSKYYFDNDYEPEILNGILDFSLHISFFENADNHIQTLQEFYNNYF
jgi:hypothetical protein